MEEIKVCIVKKRVNRQIFPETCKFFNLIVSERVVSNWHHNEPNFNFVNVNVIVIQVCRWVKTHARRVNFKLADQ